MLWHRANLAEWFLIFNFKYLKYFVKTQLHENKNALTEYISPHCDEWKKRELDRLFPKRNTIRTSFTAAAWLIRLHYGWFEKKNVKKLLLKTTSDTRFHWSPLSMKNWNSVLNLVEVHWFIGREWTQISTENFRKLLLI